MGVGIAKEGYRQCPHKAQGCVGTQLAGAQGPVRLGHKAGSQASPPGRGGKALSTTYRHAREDGVPSGGAGALPWLTLKRKEPLSAGARMEDPLEINSWAAGQALEMETSGFKSRIGLF